MDQLMELLPLLIPLLIIQFSLQIYCIINLVKREKVRFNNKFLWGVIILGLSIIGPIIYLTFRDEG